MKISQILNKSKAELIKELNGLLKARLGLQMQIKTQQLNNTAQLRKIRKDIARIKTVINLR